MFMVAPLVLQAVTSGLLSPQDVQKVFARGDYPAAARARGEQGATAVEIVTRPDGSVDSCKVILSSGFPDLDKATCPIIEERAIFNPATSASGGEVYGAFRTVVSWSLDGAKPVALSPDLEMTLNKAPAGASLPLTVPVSYLVKSDGAVSDCHAAEASAGTAPKVLVDLACRTLSQSSAPAVHNRKGKPVDARNETRVKFSVAG